MPHTQKWNIIIYFVFYWQKRSYDETASFLGVIISWKVSRDDVPSNHCKLNLLHFWAILYLPVHHHNLYLFPTLTSIQQINSGTLYVYRLLILVFLRHLLKIALSFWKKNHICKNLWAKSMSFLWKTHCELVFSWTVDNSILNSTWSILTRLNGCACGVIVKFLKDNSAMCVRILDQFISFTFAISPRKGINIFLLNYLKDR